VIAYDSKTLTPKFVEIGQIKGGARNVITLIVHVTHFDYYKNILHLVQN